MAWRTIVFGLALCLIAPAVNAETPAPSTCQLSATDVNGTPWSKGLFGRACTQKAPLVQDQAKDPLSNHYAVLEASYSLTDGTSFYKNQDGMWGKIMQLIDPQVKEFVLVLDLKLKRKSGELIPLNTVPVADFKIDDKSTTFHKTSVSDHLDEAGVAPLFAIQDGDDIVVTPKITYVKNNTVDTTLLGEAIRASTRATGAGALVGSFTAQALSSNMQVTANLVNQALGVSVSVQDAWHLTPDDTHGYQMLRLEIFNSDVAGAPPLGTLTVLVVGRCSLLTSACTNDYSSVIPGLNLDSVTIWPGSPPNAPVTLKSVVTGPLPRVSPELNPTSAPTASVASTCTSLSDALGSHYLGLTDRDAAAVAYRVVRDANGFENTALVAPENVCYQDFVTQWAKIGLAPAGGRQRVALATSLINSTLSNLKNWLTIEYSLRDASWESGGVDDLTLGSVNISVAPNTVQPGRVFAATLDPKDTPALLKGFQVTNWCVVDASTRTAVLGNDVYVARGFIKGKLTAAAPAAAIVDPRTLFLEVRFDNHVAAGLPPISGITLHPASAEEWHNYAGSCPAALAPNPAVQAQNPYSPSPLAAVPTP